MEYLYILFPILTVVPFIISSFIIRKAVNNLNVNTTNKYLELKKANSRKMLIFVFFTMMFFAIKKSIEKIVDPYFLSIGIILFVFSSMVYFFLNWMKLLKANQFPEEFISKFKLSERIKIGCFLLIMLFLLIMFNYTE